MLVDLFIGIAIGSAGALMMLLAVALMTMRTCRRDVFDGGFDHDNGPRITRVRGQYIKEEKPGEEL